MTQPTTLPASITCWCGGATTMTFNTEGLWAYRCVDSEFHDPTSDGRPTEITTLYVSGPMSGYPDCNYPAFKEAAHALRLAGYIVVDPSEVTAPGRHHYTDLLKEDIRNLMECHGVALLDNWWESSGARCEVQVAGVVRLPVRTVAEWLALKVEATPHVCGTLDCNHSCHSPVEHVCASNCGCDE